MDIEMVNLEAALKEYINQTHGTKLSITEQLQLLNEGRRSD